jgi:membrane-associated protease RseP (regulator of RpoE activity)
VDDPLILIWLMALLAPPVPDGHAIMLSGPLMAGWVGCLATAVNLFPIGQLDGGHLCYALSARFHRVSSYVALGVFVLLGLVAFPGWLFLATLLVAFGPRHPPVVDGSRGLTAGRVAIAALSLLILIVCFIPRPFAVDL